MARRKTRRTSTTKPSPRHASTHRTTTSRTLTKKQSNTLGIAAAVGLGALALAFFWPSTASAATSPQPMPTPGLPPGVPVGLPGMPGVPGIPGMPGAPGGTVPVIPRPGQELVVSGPGRTAAPSGLKLRRTPQALADDSNTIRTLPIGTPVTVISSNGAGWLQVSVGGTDIGWVCSTCPEGAETSANIAAGQVRPWIRPA